MAGTDEVASVVDLTRQIAEAQARVSELSAQRAHAVAELMLSHRPSYLCERLGWSRTTLYRIAAAGR